jgi:hypothetical protein
MASLPALSLWERELVEFYKWEHRGRGWWVWPRPVCSETDGARERPLIP